MAQYILYQDLFEPVWVQTPESVTLDKWAPSLPEPIQNRLQLHAAAALLTSGSFYVAPNVEQVGLWSPITLAAGELVRAFPYKAYTAPVYTPPEDEEEVPPLDSWFSPPIEPVYPKLDARRQSLFQPEREIAPETVTLDKWYVQPNIPAPQRPPFHIEGVRVGNVEPIPNPPAPEMSWWQPTTTPVFSRPRNTAHVIIIAPVMDPEPGPVTPGGPGFVALYEYQRHAVRYVLVMDEDGALHAKKKSTVAPSEAAQGLFLLNHPLHDRLVFLTADGDLKIMGF